MQGTACAAVCSLLSWIAQELKNKGKRDYGNDIKYAAKKFGQQVSECQKSAKRVSEVNKSIRETVDPDLLPRLANSMNEWIKGDTMSHMNACMTRRELVLRTTF